MRFQHAWQLPDKSIHAMSLQVTDGRMYGGEAALGIKAPCMDGQARPLTHSLIAHSLSVKLSRSPCQCSLSSSSS